MLSPLATRNNVVPLAQSAYSLSAAAVLSDTFTDSDGVELGDGTGGTHAPDVGSAWIQRNPGGGTKKMEIGGNRAVFDGAGTSVAGAYSETGVSNILITADFIASGNSALFGIEYRGVSTGNQFFAMANESTATMIIYEWTSSVLTIRATSAFTYVAATSYPAVISASGNVHEFTLGATMISYTTAVRNTATQHGVAQLGGSLDGEIDNIVIVSA